MLQCVEPKPLPRDLDDILNGNPEHGVLYVTFGTCLHANMMADKTRVALGLNSIQFQLEIKRKRFSPRNGGAFAVYKPVFHRQGAELP